MLMRPVENFLNKLLGYCCLNGDLLVLANKLTYKKNGNTRPT